MTKRKQAFDAFIAQGWDAAQAAGLVANLEAESGLCPEVVGDGGMAYGVAQWHPPRQAHFAEVFGKPIQDSSFEEQLAFVHIELQTTEKAAGTALAACLTPSEAGACVSRWYERPADREGEAAKRAALAERIFVEMNPDAALTRPAPAAPVPQPESTMPFPAIIGFLASLLPSVLPIFAPKLQKAVGKVTGQPPEVAGPFIADLFAKIGQATGILTAGQEVTTAAQAVQIAGAVQTAAAPVIAEIETHALDYLEKLAPVLEQLHSISKEEWSASEDSMDRAAARAIGQAYDPARMLTYFSIGTVGALTLFLCAWISILVFKEKPVGTEVWAALTGMIGWITAKLGGIYDNRFGTTRQSAAKDVVIQQLSQRK